VAAAFLNCARRPTRTIAVLAEPSDVADGEGVAEEGVCCPTRVVAVLEPATRSPAESA
jgi:hypothetical protein